MPDEKPKAPAFQFYVNEWRGSRTVQRMTFAQRGMYLEMLVEQWDQGSLPDHPEAVADLLGGTVEEWLANWPVLRRKFVDRRSRAREGQFVALPSDFDASRRIVNLRLERVRKMRKLFIESKQNAGRAGGTAKARHRQELRASTNLAVLESAVAEPSRRLANPSSSSSSSSSTSTSTSTSVEEKNSSEPQAAHEPVDASPSLLVFPTIGAHGHEWHLRETQETHWRDLFPSVDVLSEARKALAWLQANPTKRKTVKGMPRFLVAWLTRSVDRGGQSGVSAPRAVARPQPKSTDWWSECQELHEGSCTKRWDHETKMQAQAVSA